MFKEINELCNLFFSLLHTSNVIKLDLDIPQSLYFISFFTIAIESGHNWIGTNFPKDEDSNSNTDERSEETKRILHGIEETVLISLKIYLSSLEFPFLLVFYQPKQIINITIILDLLTTTILVLEFNLIYAMISCYLVHPHTF